jgi:hypothetical protein
MNKIYAGIGSRETPPEVLDDFKKLGAFLAKHGYILRSGAAEGADAAFEAGCDSISGKKEIYLPWKKYNENPSQLLNDQAGWDLAVQIHPYWDNLNLNAKLLIARNSNIVMGMQIQQPCDFIICWTPDGREIGGTAQALRIAKKYKIPVYNLGNSKDKDKLRAFLRKTVLKHEKAKTSRKNSTPKKRRCSLQSNKSS